MRHLLNFFATVCSLLQDRVGSVAFIPDGTKLTRGSDDATTEIGFSRRSVTCGQGLVTWLVNETFGLVLVFVTFDLNKLSKIAQSIRIMRSTKLLAVAKLELIEAVDIYNSYFAAALLGRNLICHHKL